jgi:RNA polymerase sigma-70 factor (ECF subfamily)
MARIPLASSHASLQLTVSSAHALRSAPAQTHATEGTWISAWPATLPSLRRAALHLTRDRDEADDLLQETALRAHRFAAGFRTGTCARAWLHRILRNTFASRYRKRRREREILERVHFESAPSPAETRAQQEPSVVAASLSDEVSRSLEGLAPDFRAVLERVAVDGLSYREAADALGCPIGTVMSRLYRARGAMVASLSDAGIVRHAA